MDNKRGLRDALSPLAQGDRGGFRGLLGLFLSDEISYKIQDKKMKKKEKRLDAEKERDRLARERKEKERLKRLMEKVNELMDETEEEVKDGRKD